VEAAPDCSGVAAGDLVACAGGGYANHAEVSFVPQNLLAAVPEGVTAVQAAYGTLGAIALHGVRRAGVSLGDRVGVIGLGLVGLLAVQLARAAGGVVLATDLDPALCDTAAKLGAERATVRTDSVIAVAQAFTGRNGLDAVLICAATPSSDPIDLAAELCRDRGRIVVVGDVGIDVPRAPFYEKELELRLSRSYGPGRYDAAYEEHGHDYPIGYVRWTEQRNLAEFLRLVAQSRVDVDTLTTHRFPIEKAADAYALVTAGGAEGERPIGVVLDYVAHVGRTRSFAPRARPRHRPARDGRCRELRHPRAPARTRGRRAGPALRRLHGERGNRPGCRRALRVRSRHERRRAADRRP
jgi:threonine dehydrogenase-like Zn-dependent dehydrogenase